MARIANGSGEKEEARELVLKELSKDPHWPFLADIAVYYFYNAQSFEDPRLQKYFVQDGRWIDFLARRLPEFGKYAKQNP